MTIGDGLSYEELLAHGKQPLEAEDLKKLDAFKRRFEKYPLKLQLAICGYILYEALGLEETTEETIQLEIDGNYPTGGGMYG